MFPSSSTHPFNYSPNNDNNSTTITPSLYLNSGTNPFQEQHMSSSCSSYSQNLPSPNLLMMFDHEDQFMMNQPADTNTNSDHHNDLCHPYPLNNNNHPTKNSPFLLQTDQQPYHHHHHHHLVDGNPAADNCYNAPILQQQHRKSSNSSSSNKSKERHSKIETAGGVRDRRVRLSIATSRKFFDLQDMLGFDKPSKTLDWLFSSSSSAIHRLHIDSHSRALYHNNANTSSTTASTSHSESAAAAAAARINEAAGSNNKSTPVAPEEVDQTFVNRRAKARARARERTSSRSNNKLLLMSTMNQPAPNSSPSAAAAAALLVPSPHHYYYYYHSNNQNHPSTSTSLNVQQGQPISDIASQNHTPVTAAARSGNSTTPPPPTAQAHHHEYHHDQDYSSLMLMKWELKPWQSPPPAAASSTIKHHHQNATWDMTNLPPTGAKISGRFREGDLDTILQHSDEHELASYQQHAGFSNPPRLH